MAEALPLVEVRALGRPGEPAGVTEGATAGVPLPTAFTATTYIM